MNQVRQTAQATASPSYLNTDQRSRPSASPLVLARCRALLFLASSAFAQTMKAPDITKDPTLYVVPYAHLDTQWRWEMPQTISEYLLKTMRVNFDLHR